MLTRMGDVLTAEEAGPRTAHLPLGTLNELLAMVPSISLYTTSPEQGGIMVYYNPYSGLLV